MRAFFLVLIGLVFLWLVFTWLRNRKTGGGRYSGGNPISGVPKDDLRRLRNICRGNVEQMNRLIEYEKGRHPGIGNGEACRRAIASLTRDNR